MNIYAVYKGDKFLFMGTSKECAKYFGVKQETVWFWNSPINKRRAKENSKRKLAITIKGE